ncbi:hypothetical protein GF377_09310, partial [candidate division GN15 bacterium]|nr:hypothetical protein [candidate division GN15 bacterium]
MPKKTIYIWALALALSFAVSGLAQTAPPVLDPIGAQTGAENQTLTINVTSSDVDLTTPSLSTSTPLPTGASFNDAGDGTGTFSWTPGFDQAGNYSVTFYATDEVTADVDSEIVAITISNTNQAPTITTPGNQTIAENSLLTFDVTGGDPDGTTPALLATDLPTGATFNDGGTGTGTFSWTPGFTQEGSYDVAFSAADATDTTSEVVTITVT